MIGLSGIVAKETPRTFVIVKDPKIREEKNQIGQMQIERADEVKTIIKQGTVLRIKLPVDAIEEGGARKELYVELWGYKLMKKPSERTKDIIKDIGFFHLY